MAYSFVAASSQYLNTSTTPVTAAPLTLAGFGYTTSNSINQAPVGVFRPTSASGGFLISFSGLTAGDPIICVSWDEANSTAIATTTTGFSTSTWTHAAGVIAATNSRNAYINGGSNGSNTASRTPASLSRILIGVANSASGMSNYFDGSLAEIAIWNVALTDAEIVSLAKGFKPTRVRPQSLVFYAPLVRNLADLRGALTITNNNTATVANHPRVY